MDTDIVKVNVLGLVPTSEGVALFLGTDGKVFVIYIDPVIANVISMTLNKEKKERPLTHDLMSNTLKGLGATVDYVVINHTNNGTFYARLFVFMHNELATKVLEVDARPSDCIILALQDNRPIYAARSVVDAVEDVSEVWERICDDQKK